MTKHGHKSYKEFEEEWNNLDDRAKILGVYDTVKERWLYKWRTRIYRIAISTISGLIAEKGDRPCEDVLEDIKRTIDAANEQIADKKW